MTTDEAMADVMNYLDQEAPNKKDPARRLAITACLRLLDNLRPLEA